MSESNEIPEGMDMPEAPNGQEAPAWEPEAHDWAKSLKVGEVKMGGNIPALFAALARAQKKVGTAKRTGNNPHLDSTFATLDAVWKEAQSVYPDEGICVMQMPHTSGAFVSVTCMIGHTAGGWMATTATAKGRNEGAQEVGSAITYLRRYTMSAMLGIVQEDDDGEAAQHGGQGRPPQGNARIQAPARARNSPSDMRDEGDRIVGREPPPAENRGPEFLGLHGPDGKNYRVPPGARGVPLQQNWLLRFQGALKQIGTPEGVTRWVDKNAELGYLAPVMDSWPDIAEQARSAAEKRRADLEFPPDQNPDLDYPRPAPRGRA